MTVPALRESINSQWYGPMIFWGMIVFWGLVWPWVLVAMHKSPARRTLERIIGEVCRGETAAMATAPVGRRFTSEARVLGMPMVSIAMGPDPTTGAGRGVAKGFIAVGDIAVGVFAVGGVSVGLVCTGGLSLGGIALGGLALGGLAMGGCAAGVCAMGGVAVGFLALGGVAIGVHALGGQSITLGILANLPR